MGRVVSGSARLPAGVELYSFDTDGVACPKAPPGTRAIDRHDTVSTRPER
ncbi:hypothetical protein [Actinophytocola oryzae]|nr:hypothetical protein [Actinophytocola oryzae]